MPQPRIMSPSLALVCMSLLMARPQLQARDAEQVAGEYAAVVRDLAQATSADSTLVVENAKRLLENLNAKLQSHEEASRSIESAPGLVRADKRLVSKAEIIELVFELGAAGERLRIAKAWGGLAVREQRVKLAEARQEAKTRNQAEVARVYSEVQAKIQDREIAALQLWALASGQAYVRVTETYSNGAATSSRGRAATPLETLGFVQDLQQRASAPLWVSPPRFTSVKDLFTLADLTKNKDSSKAVSDLAARVDGELNRLAAVHAQACRLALASESEAERRHAMMSLGWWNGREERAAIEAALEHPSEQVKDAAFAALHRLRPSSDMLKRLAKKDSRDVRREAAILAGECVGDTKGALEVARDLTLDDDGDVRQSAYTSLDSLLAISNSSSLRALDFSKQALESQQPNVTTDAIRWISSLSGEEDFSARRRQLLAPLSQHRIEAIRQAAGEALR